MPGPNRLREELTRRGLTPLALSKILGMPCRTVRDVIRGSQDIRLRDVAIVAEALGFKPNIVLESKTILDDLLADPPETKKPRRPQVKWR